MKVKIKRIDKSLPLPEYQTEGSVCFDLMARSEVNIPPKKLGFIPCNLIIEIPEGFMLLIASRSSMPKKKGLLIPHGIGIIDQDYRGVKDELICQVYNFNDQNVVVLKGERIAQGCLIPVAKVTFEEVEEVSDKTRGGFGSTG